MSPKCLCSRVIRSGRSLIPAGESAMILGQLRTRCKARLDSAVGLLNKAVTGPFCPLALPLREIKPLVWSG